MSAPSELFVRNALALAAFVVVLCESISGFRDELKFIWSRPMSWVKGVYLISRYSVLIGCIANIILLFFGPLWSFPNRPDDCRDWFSIMAIIAYIQTLAIDAFSAVRVFVLYNPDSRAGLFAAGLIITEVVLVSLSSADAMMSSTYTSTCRVVSTPRQVIAFSVWLGGTQLSLIGLTLYKLRTLSGDKEQGATVLLVLQQGIFLCSLILVLSMTSLIHGLLTGTADPNLFAAWPSVFTSSALCRVIINLRRSALQRDVRVRVEERSKIEIQFTSWLSSPSEEEEQPFRLDDGNSVLRRRPVGSSAPSDGSGDAPAKLHSSFTRSHTHHESLEAGRRW